MTNQPPPLDPFEPGDLNLPFEPSEPSPLTGHVHWSGGVVVASLLLDADRGKHPAVMLRFAKADGTGFYPPMILACDDPARLQALPGLLEQAIQHAIASAS